MPLPPERARAFEAAGKQGCDCVAWSRKRRTGFSSRQGVYESPVPRPMPDYRTKCPSRIATPTKKRTDFLLKIGMGGKAILGLSRPFQFWEKKGPKMNECGQTLLGIGHLVHPSSGAAGNGQGRASAHSFQP